MSSNELGPSGDLSGRVALVTGGGRGIGAATAIVLARAGAITVVTARSRDELEETASLIAGIGGKVSSVVGDLTNQDFVFSLFEEVERKHGRLDILVNNAGRADFAPVEVADADAFRSVLELNTIAPYACMREAIRLMKVGEDDGFIVNIGSTEAYWTAYGESGFYPASKFALRAITMAVSKELKQAGSGIRVCMVNPGGTNTRSVNPSGEADPRLLDPFDVGRAVLHVVTAGPGVHVFDTVLLSQSAYPW